MADNVRTVRSNVRLSVNLAFDVAGVLRRWASAEGISITESIRHAIALWNFVETERANGNTIAVVEQTWYGNRIREVEFDD